MEQQKELVIDLVYPIIVGETTISKLRFSGRIKAKHLKNMPIGENLDMGGMLGMISGIFGIPLSVANELDMVDLNAVSEALAPLLGEFQETGKKSSGR